VRLYTRSTADTPNRLTVEFQDSLNEYQQDSFSLVDPEDVAPRAVRKWRRRWRRWGDRELRPGEPGVEAEPG